MGNFRFCCWPDSPDASCTMLAAVAPLGCSPESVSKALIAEDTTHLGCKIWRNQTGTSSLLTSYHTARGCNASCWGRKGINNHQSPHDEPTNCNTNLQARCAHRCHNSLTVTGEPSTGISFQACLPRGNSCLVLQTQLRAWLRRFYNQVGNFLLLLS